VVREDFELFIVGGDRNIFAIRRPMNLFIGGIDAHIYYC
jgi:hypothetical protein